MVKGKFLSSGECWNTLSLPLFPDLLSPEQVIPISFQGMGPIDLFKNWTK